MAVHFKDGEPPSLANPLPVQVVIPAPVTATLVDQSYTFPDGLSHQVLGANPDRKFLSIFSPIWETADATIGPTGAPAVVGATPGIQLSPGDEWKPLPVPVNPITAIGMTGHKLVILEG